MQEDSTTLDLQQDSQKYLVTGAVVLLAGSSWILFRYLKSSTQLLMERLMEKAPVLEALEISEGSRQFKFKTVSFSEEKVWRKPKRRISPEMEVELYTSQNTEPDYYELSQREPSVSVNVKPDTSVQIRFRYKTGQYWTAWSEIIKKDVPRAAFQLADFRRDQQQPNNEQEFDEGEQHYNQLCQELKEKIQGPGGVQVQAPNEVQVQGPDEVQIQDPDEVQVQGQGPNEVQVQGPGEVQIQYPDKVVIRLMGQIGIGKSSFINTAFCAMVNKWKMIAVSYGANVSVTKEVKKYEFVSNKVWLADMPGFQNDSNFEIIEDVIAGCYDHGGVLDLKKALQKDDERANRLMQSRAQQKTAVILVLSIKDLKAGVDEVSKKIIEQLVKLNEPCIAVVTKVDGVRDIGDEAITEKNFFTDPRVQACCNKLKKFGVQSVFPLMNYSGNTDPDCRVNYAILKILEDAIELAS